MNRISFETRTDSDDPINPEAWRKEAANLLRKIATRISAGETMPLNLFRSDGICIGKAREISYKPEPPRH
jgi:hypothetical protein